MKMGIITSGRLPDGRHGMPIGPGLRPSGHRCCLSHTLSTPPSLSLPLILTFSHPLLLSLLFPSFSNFITPSWSLFRSFSHSHPLLVTFSPPSHSGPPPLATSVMRWQATRSIILTFSLPLAISFPLFLPFSCSLSLYKQSFQNLF